jgi:hypothetical protein
VATPTVPDNPVDGRGASAAGTTLAGDGFHPFAAAGGDDDGGGGGIGGGGGGGGGGDGGGGDGGVPATPAMDELLMSLGSASWRPEDAPAASEDER